jgi:hypothetical protein
MKFFNLSLRRRLLLAIIPGFVLPLALVADVFIDGWYLDDEKMILVSIAFAALFGVFVMAPFITSPSRLILRISALIAASILIPYAAILSGIWLDTEYNLPLGGILGRFIFAIFVILSALLLAAVLIIAAPLKVSGKYWIYVALAAIVTTAVFFGSGRFIYRCIPGWIGAGCPRWSDFAFVIPPFVVAPLSFCTAVYFGRIDSKRVEQITTESERE